MAKHETVIWTSKLFPKLVMTKEHLEVLRYAYGSVIKEFEPELKKAEAWLFVNPARRPKKNWRSFINNWMSNAVEFKGQKGMAVKRSPEYGESARSLKTNPRQFNEIMQGIADRMPKSDKETNQQNPQSTKE